MYKYYIVTHLYIWQHYFLFALFHNRPAIEPFKNELKDADLFNTEFTETHQVKEENE